jgi:hypothetical protein
MKCDFKESVNKYDLWLKINEAGDIVSELRAE